MSDGAHKRSRTRVHRAKVESEIDGVTYRFGMQRDGVHVRQHYSRKVFVVPLPELLTLAQGQLLLGMAGVAQTSKSAVSPVSKPADAPTSPADLEVCDTAGLETCATAEALPARGCEPDARGVIQHDMGEIEGPRGPLWICRRCGKVVKLSKKKEEAIL